MICFHTTKCLKLNFTATVNFGVLPPISPSPTKHLIGSLYFILKTENNLATGTTSTSGLLHDSSSLGRTKQRAKINKWGVGQGSPTIFPNIF